MFSTIETREFTLARRHMLYYSGQLSLLPSAGREMSSSLLAMG